MFTGIITDVGRIAQIVETDGGRRLTVATGYDVADIAIGASVAHDGCCMTVTTRGSGAYVVEASAETLSKTTLGDWTVGRRVNLERPLRAGDELGGHLVLGHVDGIAVVTDIRSDGNSLRVRVEAPPELAPFIAPKGSVALDGVSLTVNEVSGNAFGVNIIPHTRSCTTFETLRAGHRANFEIDMLARYVARLLETRQPVQPLKVSA